MFEAFNQIWTPRTRERWKVVVFVGFSDNKWPLKVVSIDGAVGLLGLSEVKPLTPAAAAILAIAREGAS